MIETMKEIETSFKELDNLFNKWLVKQSLTMETAVVAIKGGIRGAAVTWLAHTFVFPGTFVDDNPKKKLKVPMVPSLLAGGTLIHVRNMAVYTGVNDGISCVMKRFRGKVDVETRFVAGFGAGVMASLVCGMTGINVIENGIIFALMNGGLFKVNEMISQSLNSSPTTASNS